RRGQRAFRVVEDKAVELSFVAFEPRQRLAHRIDRRQFSRAVELQQPSRRQISDVVGHVVLPPQIVMTTLVSASPRTKRSRLPAMPLKRRSLAPSVALEQCGVISTLASS